MFAYADCACCVQGKLHGIITCEHGQLAGLKLEAVAWGSDIKRMLALCHDLVPLSKGQIVGPLDEQKAFAAVEASFVVCIGMKCKILCCRSGSSTD